MVLLRENFIQLQYVGLWQPPCWPPNSFKSRAYLIYTIHLLTILNCFMISEALGLFTIIENLEDFSDSCFMMLTIFSVCVKSMVVLLKRSDIIDILSSLEMNPYKPMNIHEEKIQEFFNRRIRFFTFLYGGVVEISVWIMSISAFFQGIPFGVLPYKVWLPFDYSQPILYWSTFCAQLFVITLGANICIGCDTVIPGFYTLYES
ncbi:uncharacterized protein [Fopius arisanus]|uniref:Odorant receptor n=1 Tax=Fopius arisanus TaxID=64838 RepID=A0A9R1U705_9HYME|nr:PREDICTED: uncharacterized protein LOC105271436 [Fopius arisanus]